ncbi:UNVERIFIED_CONTAM: hypothetical protein PYX00_003287 [Menopon gallinae]|uniref:Uncharacterized protein n=1 Tax=Menopon gallinae TaxID=328185 RepID=A0AAW2I164_9NEOP
MYLAGKLSKFEVVDWIGRTQRHLFWWDMFVEDVTMNLLEDICHQVLDLYSPAKQETVPDSPPLTRSPAFKKERIMPIPTVVSPNITQLTPSPLGKAAKPIIGEVKVPSQEKPHLINENSTGAPFPPSFTTPAGPGPGGPPPPAFPPAYPATYPPPPTAQPPPANFYSRPPTSYFPPP